MPVHHNKTDDYIDMSEYFSGHGSRFRFDSACFRFGGIDLGLNGAAIISHDKKTGAVMLKVNGRTGWCMRGESNYVPPEYFVGHVVDDRWHHLITIQYTRKYQKPAKMLAEAYFELAKRSEPKSIDSTSF